MSSMRRVGTVISRASMISYSPRAYGVLYAFRILERDQYCTASTVRSYCISISSNGTEKRQETSTDLPGSEQR